jgi:hypothetical protein
MAEWTDVKRDGEPVSIRGPVGGSVTMPDEYEIRQRTTEIPVGLGRFDVSNRGSVYAPIDESGHVIKDERHQTGVSESCPVSTKRFAGKPRTGRRQKRGSVRKPTHSARATPLACRLFSRCSRISCERSMAGSGRNGT